MSDKNTDKYQEEVVKEIPTGMVEFTYGKKLGTISKDTMKIMHKSTADALIAHKIGKITKVIKVLRKDEPK